MKFDPKLVSQTEADKTIEFETEFGEIEALFNCPLKITAGNSVYTQYVL